jgi:hypothetical protein
MICGRVRKWFPGFGKGRPRVSIYEERSESPVLIESIVAFIDLLGSKDAAQNLETQQRRLDQLVRGISRARNMAALPNVDGFAATATFTDNIVVGYPLDRTGYPDTRDPDAVWAVLLRVLGSAAGYQLELAMEGLFVRGGMAIGPLWIDELFVFGAGLMSAYNIESKGAHYPRIVVSDDIVKMARWVRPHLGKQSREWLDSYLLRGWDGAVFVNYLFDNSTRIVPTPDYLATHRAAIGAGLFDNQTTPVVYEKYLWLRTYHNYYCQQVGAPEYLMEAREELYEFFPFDEDHG